MLPHPNLRVLAPNIKFFVNHNVKGIFEQGAYHCPGAEMAHLRTWVLAKLLWDPTLDGQKLIDEFIDGYYGPAAPHIRAYLKLIHDEVEASGDWLDCWSGDTAKFLSFQTLNKGWKYLKAAEAAVQGDSELHFRVQVTQLPVIYTFILRWDEMRYRAKYIGAEWPMPDSIETTFEDFMKVAKKKGITSLGEVHRNYERLEKAVKRAKK